jgi:hypothetical protein
MMSLPERTAKKTLVASIVAPHGNGCKQASYTVHVTIWTEIEDKKFGQNHIIFTYDYWKRRMFTMFLYFISVS